MLKKKEIDIINNFDFNFLCKVLDSGDFNSSPVTRWFDNYICDSVFRIKEVHKSRFLFSLYDLLNKKYNLKKYQSDLDIFYCTTSGGKSPTHLENYDVYIIGVMEHIEPCGIHSGDSACSLPPVSIKPFLIKEIERQTKNLAIALKVKGFMNVQFAIKKDEIFVIEVNPRASRTVPFVSKAKGLPLAKIASRVMAGEKLLKFNLKDTSFDVGNI